MADNRLDKTGLQYFFNRLKTIFAAKTEVNTLSSRVDEIAREGGEPNTIEVIKCDGEELPINSTDKSVDIGVAVSYSGQASIETFWLTDRVDNLTHVQVSSWRPDGDIDGLYVGFYEDDSETGRSSSIYGMNLPSWDKVQSAIPDSTSDLTNDSGFQTATQVQSAISSALGDITGIDYEVVTALPTTGEAGTIYLIANSGSAPNIYDEYIWTGSAFEKIGTTDVDLTGYWNETNLPAITTAEIDAIIDGE